MIGKVCPRGQDVAGLIRYLYGPGRREEHTDPHIIAGYRPPADLEPPLRARRQPGLPPPGRAAPAPARRARQVGVRQAGLALLDARRPRATACSPTRKWAAVARDVMHRTGLCPRGRGRRRGAVDRDPARPGPHPPGGDAGPPGPDPPPRRERTLPGPGCLPRRRAAVRAAVHRPGRPHRGPPPHPRRDRQSRPPRPGRAAPDHAAPPRLHRRRIRRQRRGVLRPAGPGRGAGPAPVQHQEPRPGHRVRRRPPRRHHQERRNRSGTEAASSPPTCPGPGSPSGGPARPGRTPR